MTEISADYDSAWKQAISELFEPFLEFFFPKVHKLIDWKHEVVPLETELQQITPVATTGKKLADKLYRVKLNKGRTVWILIHIEVQSQNDSDFNKRMFQYHYRAFDLYEEKVISLALLGDQSKNWRPSSFGYSIGGCKLTLQYPMVKLIDYDPTELDNHENPLAILVLAHLKTNATTKNLAKREGAKWELVKSLYERGYNEERIMQLFKIIDWMMTLPEELQNQFETKLEQYVEEQNVEVMSRIEQRALALGEQRGEQRGIKIGEELGIKIGEQRGAERGIQEGTQQTLKSNIITILLLRFQTISPELVNKINRLNNIPELERLLSHAVTIASISEFTQLLNSNLS